MNKVISKKSTVDELANEIKTKKPKIVVLMDNTSISLFKKYQIALPEEEKTIPSIAVMSVLIKDAISDIKNIEGNLMKYRLSRVWLVSDQYLEFK